MTERRPNDPEPENRTGWAIVAMAVLGGILAALHVGKVPPALPRIREELQLGLVTSGFVVSIFNLLGMSLALFVGSLADRLGRVRLVATGIACLIAGGAAGAMAGALPLLLVARAIEGVGFIAISVAMPAIVIAAASARDRPFALSLWSIYTPFGMALALALSPVVMQLAGWRGLWLGVLAVTLLAAGFVLWAIARVRLPPPPPGRPGTVILETLAQGGLWLLALAFGGYAFQWISLMVWLPTFLPEEFGLAPLAAALVTALVVLINVPGNILGGWMLRRGVPARWLILLGSLAMGLTALGIFLPHLGAPARIVLCFAFSFLGGFVPTSLFSSVPGQAPTLAHLGAANGMLMQGSSTGQFIGAPLVAAAVAAAGGAWQGAVVPMLGAATLAAAAGWFAAAPYPRIGAGQRRSRSGRGAERHRRPRGGSRSR